MNTLIPEWNQERPSSRQAKLLWDAVSIEPIDSWTKAARVLRQKIAKTHINGGIQLHKFRFFGNLHFVWFASRNRLTEIAFPENFLSRPELKKYRKNLKIKSDKPKVKILSSPTDMYDLPGRLARILGQGGAYKNLDARTAWKAATDFVNKEFQNRFDEILTFNISIDSAGWFYGTAWDYSLVLFDKRNSEITIIDITDTD